MGKVWVRIPSGLHFCENACLKAFIGSLSHENQAVARSAPGKGGEGYLAIRPPCEQQSVYPNTYVIYLTSGIVVVDAVFVCSLFIDRD